MLLKSFLLFVILIPVVLSRQLEDWGLFIAFVLIICVGSDMLDIILVACFRETVVAYIREHGQEIETVA